MTIAGGTARSTRAAATCCGNVLQEDIVVRIRKEQILVPDNIIAKGKMKERMALTINWVSDGIDCCHVGFLLDPYVVQG